MLCALRRDDGDAWSEHRHLDGEGARLTLSREPDAPQLATARRSVCASNAAALLNFESRYSLTIGLARFILPNDLQVSLIGDWLAHRHGLSKLLITWLIMGLLSFCVSRKRRFTPIYIRELTDSC